VLLQVAVIGDGVEVVDDGDVGDFGVSRAGELAVRVLEVPVAV
jgi:hypothetical protein